MTLVQTHVTDSFFSASNHLHTPNVSVPSLEAAAGKRHEEEGKKEKERKCLRSSQGKLERRKKEKRNIDEKSQLYQPFHLSFDQGACRLRAFSFSLNCFCHVFLCLFALEEQWVEEIFCFFYSCLRLY